MPTPAQGLDGGHDQGAGDGRRGFTVSYFHRAQELAAELRTAGPRDVQVLGIEGPSWPLLKAVEQAAGAPPDDARGSGQHLDGLDPLFSPPPSASAAQPRS